MDGRTAMVWATILIGAARPGPRPDPDYRARVGDRAFLYSVNPRTGTVLPVTGATDSVAFRDYWKSITIRDREGARELEESGDVVGLESGTRVLVLEIHDYGPEDMRPDAAEVRLLDGARQGERFWVARFHVARLIDEDGKPVPTSPAPDVRTAPGAIPGPSRLSTHSRSHP